MGIGSPHGMSLIELAGVAAVGELVVVVLVVGGLVLAGVVGVGVLGGPVVGVLSVVDAVVLDEGASVGAVLASDDWLSEPQADTATTNAKEQSAVELGARFKTMQL